MTCPTCGADVVEFPVEASLRECLPGDEPGAALCTTCLTLRPVPDPPSDLPDLTVISDAVPADDEAAVPLALLLGLLDSLALYRQEIEGLLERVERAGVDPLLVVDRLAADPSVDSEADLERRRHQLEQLL